MTKFGLVLAIASGIVLGQLALEVLGILFHQAGKLMGSAIAERMKRLASTQQAGTTQQP
jgi:hypothetical protein